MIPDFVLLGIQYDIHKKIIKREDAFERYESYIKMFSAKMNFCNNHRKNSDEL
jgi:hypothetical protein